MNEPSTIRPVMGVASMIGNQVVSAEGDELGTVRELLIDAELGTVAFAVVSFQGQNDLDSSLLVVPWQTLRLQPEQDRFVFDVDRAMRLGDVASAPDSIFEEDGWEWVTNGRESFGLKTERN